MPSVTATDANLNYTLYLLYFNTGALTRTAGERRLAAVCADATSGEMRATETMLSLKRV